MAKAKYDGVVEAVHYTPDGQVAWVRAYLRRGPVFSDRVKLDRETLVGHIKSGKQFMVGKRIPYWGATFEVSETITLKQADGQEFLTVGDEQAHQEFLVGVPVI